MPHSDAAKSLDFMPIAIASLPNDVCCCQFINISISPFGVQCKVCSKKDLTSGEGSVIIQKDSCGFSSIGRAPASQAGCCGFESRNPLH